MSASKIALAYELRRLATRLLAVMEDRETPLAPPGELAQSLATTFELTALEVDIALVVLGIEIDAELARLFAAAAQVARPTELAVLAALVPVLEQRLAVLRVIGAESALVRRRLVRREAGVLAPTRRFRAAVLGEHPLANLPACARRITGQPLETSWLPDPRRLAAAMWREAPPSSLCVVSGATGAGKTVWARSLALAMSQPALYVDLAAAETSDEICELVADAALAGHAIVLDNARVPEGSRFASALADAFDEAAAQVVLVVDDIGQLDPRIAGRALARIAIAPPPAEERRRLWGDVPLGVEDVVLGPRQIRNAAALVAGGAMEPLAAAVEQMQAPGQRTLTVPDPAVARLDALVLPADTRAEIVEIIGAIRHRRQVHAAMAASRTRGISALFDGDSGTGKTLACEVIAAEAGLPLMRVNIATLVDKYVGETEKNLTRVFAEAAAHGGILFFDEADALFGARENNGRSHEKFANLATNLLLQLMEGFTGVVLLTTNLKQNIDQAFMRRLTFKVYFEPPERGERERLWKLHVPPALCGRDVDIARLAGAFELTGGSIRAAAVRAAYRAAAAERHIEMTDLIDCAKLEAAGMGRVTTFA